MFGFQESLLFAEQSYLNTFSVVPINNLQLKFGLFNSICCVLVLVFEFPNLTDFSITLVGTKAYFLLKACLSDKKSSP